MDYSVKARALVYSVPDTSPVPTTLSVAISAGNESTIYQLAMTARAYIRKEPFLYQPITHICVTSSHKPIRIYMGVLILGANALYKIFCLFKLFPMVGKGYIIGIVVRLT